jgi:site-specific DNA-methyltransferase (adenine-specific)
MEYDLRDLPLSELEVAQEDFEPIHREVIEDLKADLQAKPLLHPLTVVEDGKFYVKAGRKRFYAAKELNWITIPCFVLPPGLSQDDIEEITISENLRRYNLPWWEQVIDRKKLHEIRQKQHGVGRQGAKVGWSLRDTAKELSIGFGTLSEDLRLAEAVLSNPSLKKIQDKRTAKRLIFSEARRIEAEAEAGMKISVEHDCVLCGDATEILKFYPNGTFDGVFTDPPWLVYKDETLTRDDQTLPVFKELYRVMKMDSFLYVVVSTPDFIFYSKELPKFGFKIQQMPLIWVKEGMLSHGLRSWEYTRDYEPILLAVKGAPALSSAGQYSAVYTSKVVHNTQTIHPNEKPIDVPKHFLEHCSYPGSLILDPFGGSGSTAIACLELNRRYVTIERDKKFADNIEKRITEWNKSKSNA